MTIAALHAFGVLVALAFVALVFGIVVVVDMARFPGWQWRQAGTSKGLWLTLEIVFILLFWPAAVVIGIVYFTGTRAKLQQVSQNPPPPYPGAYGGGAQWGGSYPATTWPGAGQPAPNPARPPGAWAPPGPPPPAAPTTVTPGDGPPMYPPTAPAPPPYVAPAPVENPPFGWYPDPSGRHETRYWDGTRWTEYVADGGQQTTEPLP